MPDTVLPSRTRAHRALWTIIVALLSPLTATAAPQPPAVTAPGFRIVSVRPNPQSNSSTQSPAAGGSMPTPMAATPFPRPPLTGFLPLVAITLSDSHKTGDLVWEHVLRSSFVGGSLNYPSSGNWVLAVVDTGSTADAISYCDSLALGLTGSNVTINPVTLGGVGGETEGLCSYPRGLFVAPLSAVSPNGVLDTSQLIGHTHVSMVVFPEEQCAGNPQKLPSLLGNDFLGLFNIIIQNDQPRHVMLNEQPFVAPSVNIVAKSIPLPAYPRRISMNTSPAGLTTASYFGDILFTSDFRTPISPTVLAAGEAAPLGGAFFASIGLLEGTPGPTNPLQTASLLVDSGSQTTVISSGMAANLNLPIEPDFTVVVQGIAGTEEVPGYYIDYVKINALGGALEFSQVPVVVVDIPAWPDGAQHDGILGMNLFWNRNVILEPNLGGSGFVHVSNPIPFAYGDFNRDLHVDGEDFAAFKMCETRSGVLHANPDCVQVDTDLDGDIDMNDFAVFQRCYSGPTVTANPACSP